MKHQCNKLSAVACAINEKKKVATNKLQNRAESEPRSKNDVSTRGRETEKEKERDRVKDRDKEKEKWENIRRKW